MTITLKPDLKPCPFCGSGSAPRTAVEGEFSYSVICDHTEGGCGAESGRRAHLIDAAQAWNDREAKG